MNARTLAVALASVVPVPDGALEGTADDEEGAGAAGRDDRRAATMGVGVAWCCDRAGVATPPGDPEMLTQVPAGPAEQGVAGACVMPAAAWVADPLSGPRSQPNPSTPATSTPVTTATLAGMAR
jgi:hypothetical protein